MKKQKVTKLFLNKVKISRIQNASLLFGGSDASLPPHEADHGNSQNDSHTTTETVGCNNDTSISPHYTCSLGAGEVTAG